jgi:hypothetical protein
VLALQGVSSLLHVESYRRSAKPQHGAQDESVHRTGTSSCPTRALLSHPVFVVGFARFQPVRWGALSPLTSEG